MRVKYIDLILSIICKHFNAIEKYLHNLLTLVVKKAIKKVHRRKFNSLFIHSYICVTLITMIALNNFQQFV